MRGARARPLDCFLARRHAHRSLSQPPPLPLPPVPAPAPAPAGLLWRLAPNLAVFLIFYSLGGTAITAAGFGKKLMRLTYSVLQREADLRFALVRSWELAGATPQPACHAWHAGRARNTAGCP